MTNHADPASADLPPIIAIGTSAGGLDAVSRLLEALPPSTGCAFIIVAHFDPSHKSLMPQLLASHTKMPVAEAIEGGALVANQVLVIPAGCNLSLRHGVLHLGEQSSHGARFPFDVLLESLTQSDAARSIAVVLTGMGKDGSKGLAGFKAGGGRVIAQKPQEAEYDSMPRSAVDTGLVDQILPIAEMPKALMAMIGDSSAVPVAKPAGAAIGIAQIIGFLREATPHDFSGYKPGTIGRRIERRMALLAVPHGDYAAYLAVLRKVPEERCWSMPC
jgi:two-component system CheB/CheR fusion protein